MKRWILRSDESTFTSFSKLQANFSKQTVWTLQRAIINKPKNFIRATFIFSPKISDKVESKIVFLLSILVFMYLGAIPASISFKILNISISNHFVNISCYQVINIFIWLSNDCNFCHVLRILNKKIITLWISKNFHYRYIFLLWHFY